MDVKYRPVANPITNITHIILKYNLFYHEYGLWPMDL